MKACRHSYMWPFRLRLPPEAMRVAGWSCEIKVEEIQTILPILR